MVCESIGVPAGILDFIQSRYNSCRACIVQLSEVRPLFQVLSGVLQGCPLSSTLFTLAIASLLWRFFKTIVQGNLGTVSACADDIAIA